MIQTFNLADKIILITGGYGHLGKAVTESLVYHGADVFVLGRHKEKFEQEFLESPVNKQRLHFQQCDIAETVSIENAFQQVINSKGKIDVIINNAVYLQGQSPESMTDAEWEKGIDGTLNSVFRCIRGIIPFFKKNGGGKIINVSSMYGVVSPDFDVYNEFPAFLNPPHYGAAKAGVIQLTKYYAAYLGKENITVNTVTPGPFPSPKVQESTKFVEELSKKTCLNRIGKPEDLAGAFVLLASDAGNFITGQNIVVDGGWTAK